MEDRWGRDHDVQDVSSIRGGGGGGGGSGGSGGGGGGGGGGGSGGGGFSTQRTTTQRAQGRGGGGGGGFKPQLPRTTSSGGGGGSSGGGGGMSGGGGGWVSNASSGLTQFQLPNHQGPAGAVHAQTQTQNDVRPLAVSSVASEKMSERVTETATAGTICIFY